MEIKPNRTDAYVCSLDPMSTVDMEILAAIRKSISVANRDAKWEQPNYGRGDYKIKRVKRVTVKGRKAIQKQLVNVGGYYGKPKLAWRSHTLFGDIVGGIANASQYDIYIHDDTRVKYG